MIKKLSKYLIFSFLLLPKINLNGNGILIGEILAFVYLILFIDKKYIISKLVLLLYLFIIIIVFISSLFASFYFNNFPLYSTFYLIRLLSYFSIYISSQKLSESELLFITNRAYIIHAVIMLFFMVLYYFLKHPKPIDYLWGYDFGLRMQPIIGAAIDVSNYPFYLQYIKGGSGNLFTAWTIYIFIMNITLNKKFNAVHYFLLCLLVALTLSRGGMITIILAGVYFYFIKNSKGLKPKIIFIVISVLMILILLYTDFLNISVFKRISNTIINGSIDPSTRLRIDNYNKVLKALLSNIEFLFCGWGFEPSFWSNLIGWSFAESFIFQILGSAGIIGLLFFCYLIIYLFKKRKNNTQYNILFYYFIIQLVLNWSIVGGDFLGPVNMYLMMLALGNGVKKQVYKNNTHEYST